MQRVHSVCAPLIHHNDFPINTIHRWIFLKLHHLMHIEFYIKIEIYPRKFVFGQRSYMFIVCNVWMIDIRKKDEISEGC